MHRSSTSSSERPRSWPKAALLAFAILLVFDVAVARQDSLWGRIPRSESGAFDALETHAIGGTPDPKIVFMGSSRVRDAVAPRLIEKDLGLEDNTVINLGITGGVPFDAKMFYQRNHASLSKADLIVIGVDPAQFSNHVTGGDERVRRFGSFSDRMDHRPGGERLPLVLGYVWRTLDAVKPLRRLAFELLGDLSSEHRDVPFGADGRIRWMRDGARRFKSGANNRKEARRHFRRFEFMPSRVEQLADVVSQMRDDGVKVLIVQFPFRDGYMRIVKRRHAKKYATYREAIATIAGDDLVWWEAGSKAGLPKRAFYDYGHASPKGTVHLSKILAREIEGRKLLGAAQ